MATYNGPKMALPPRLRTEIVLSVIAGTALKLKEFPQMERFYFQGLYDVATEALRAIPLKKFRRKKDAVRHVRTILKAIKEAQASMPDFQSLEAVLNWLLIEATDLYEELLDRKQEFYADAVKPVVEMIEQYISTMGADVEEAVEHGSRIAAGFKEGCERGYIKTPSRADDRRIFEWIMKK